MNFEIDQLNIDLLNNEHRLTIRRGGQICEVAEHLISKIVGGNS
jgi:hypothetical protein